MEVNPSIPNKTESLRKKYLSITTAGNFERSFWKRERLTAVSNEQFTLDDVMAQWNVAEHLREDGFEDRDVQTLSGGLGTSMGLSQPFDSFLSDLTPEPPSGWGPSEESAPAIPSRYAVLQNGTSLLRLLRDLARARRLMLALQTNEAIGTIDQIELQLHCISPAPAKRIRAATQLLRAVGLALQDQSLAALAIALSHLRENGTTRDSYIASTLCRLGFWQLGKFDAFYSVTRQPPRVRWSKSRAISAVFDLSIEAAMAIANLNLSTAKRLASDALTIAERTNVAPGIAALPACLIAQILYEEGYLDEANTILRDRLPAINAEGSFECVLRAYLVLARIAKQRAQYDLAAILLREAEILGERRGWPRLVAACVAERVSLMLEAGQAKEASVSAEYLDRYTDANHAGSKRSWIKTVDYHVLARWRVSWAEAPSPEAVDALRSLYHHAVEKRDLYSGVRLAIELAEMLGSIGELEEGDALFLWTLKAGAAAGLCQAFLERGAGVACLLRRAYDNADEPGSMDRNVLPFVGSLLSRWEAQSKTDRSAQPGSVSDTLSRREREILGMISEGFPNKRIARALAISPETVKSHLKRIFMKLAVGSRIEAVSRARSLGLL
jgi:LuxR family maltose regulon positive regulatory protein